MSDHSQIPAFGEKSIGKRQCTSNWKIVPLIRKAREILGFTGKRVRENSVTFWIGISLDEVHRIKPSREPWIQNRWPLIEKRMTRADCLQWMSDHNFPKPPRSACVFCPYHSDAEWREIRQDPVAMQIVRKVEMMLKPNREYLHRDKLPIDKVDLSTDYDRGQMSLFGAECEGICGV